MSKLKSMFSRLVTSRANPKTMGLKDAYEVLYEHQLWRVGNTDREMQPPMTITTAMIVVLQFVYAELKRQEKTTHES